ncbi:MAG: signal peptidase I [Candidatus Izemoplasmatales bacterium]|jgi:signal peptidase I|nr:signal peptidase I [Candidatus Izemoplasmatales bacterium]
MDFDGNLIIEEHQKLMKKSSFLIISFFLFLTIDIVLFIILQKNDLFMFQLGRSSNNIPNPMVSDIFSFIFYLIMIFALVIYLALLAICLHKVHRNNYKLLKTVHNIADFFSIVPVFLLVIFIINGFFFSFAQVDGESMEPTYCNNDLVIISYNNDIETSEILIFESEDKFLIKKVIGMPGDLLLVDETGVYINGDLIEDYIPLNHQYFNGIIPEKNYFVLGDNRDNSLDSRVFGLVSAEDVLGTVIYKMTDNCQ